MTPSYTSSNVQLLFFHQSEASQLKNDINESERIGKLLPKLFRTRTPTKMTLQKFTCTKHCVSILRGDKKKKGAIFNATVHQCRDNSLKFERIERIFGRRKRISFDSA